MSLGTALYQVGDLDSALEAYQATLRDQPDLIQAHVNLATVYTIKRDWTSARNELQAALKLRPDSIQAHYALGVVRYGLGDRRGAIEAYREALRLKPDYADAHYNLGLLLKLANQEAEAAQEFYAAALAGLPKAQYFLGSAHASGRGVEKVCRSRCNGGFKQPSRMTHRPRKPSHSFARMSSQKGGAPSRSEKPSSKPLPSFERSYGKNIPSSISRRAIVSERLSYSKIAFEKPLPSSFKKRSALSEPATTALEALYERGIEGELAPFNDRIRTFSNDGGGRRTASRFVMARLYAQGLGVPQDIKKAKRSSRGDSSDEAKTLLRKISEPSQAAGRPKSASNTSP